MPGADPYLEHAFHLAKAHLGPQSQATIPILVQVRDPSSWPPPGGCQIRSIVGTICSCDATEDAVAALLADPKVESLSASRPASALECARSVPYVGADVVHGPPRSEQGDGALIAVLDAGIDVLHEAFLDASKRCRIVEIWDQGDNTGPPPTIGGRPAYGTLHSAADIQRYVTNGNVEKGLGRDQLLGHGTHVSSIAAGAPVTSAAGILQFPGGVAPEARIVVVKTHMTAANGSPRSTGYSTAHVDALAYVDEVATRLSLPVVVNLSQGMNAGAHDGSSLLEAAFDSFTAGGRRPGRAVVKSAGNERDKKVHAGLTVGSVQDIRWSVPPALIRPVVVELWFDSRDQLSFRLRPPTGPSSPPVATSGAQIMHQSAHGDQIRVSLTRFHVDNGDSQLLVVVTPGGINGLEAGEWSLEVIPQATPAGGRIDAWIEWTSSHPVAFTSTNVEERHTLTIPGTAHHLVTVGSIEVPSPVSDPFRVANESCFGPTRDGRAVPHLVAPGVGIKAARAGTSDQVIPMSGTSMAAPHVTGAIALAFSGWGKRHPNKGDMLNQGQVRAALVASAQGPSPIWNDGTGHGRLDIDGLFVQLAL